MSKIILNKIMYTIEGTLWKNIVEVSQASGRYFHVSANIFFFISIVCCIYIVEINSMAKTLTNALEKYLERPCNKAMQ